MRTLLSGLNRFASEDPDVKEGRRSSGGAGEDLGRRVDLTVGPALGWKVGESVPSRTRGGGFVGEAGLGVTLALAGAVLLGELEYLDQVAAGGFLVDMGVALLLTFAFGRKEVGAGETRDFRGDGGLERVVREGGREGGRDDGVPLSYASFTVTFREYQLQ